MTARASKPGRLVEVDALRGVAALAVVLYHYTTRFWELYGDGRSTTLALPDGHLGVNLFFIISGFVIFMTLDRTRQPMDFVVSRFSRLFPSYWAAIWLTFAVTTTFGLPGKTVSGLQALANMLMLHGFARVPHVDGVYWTLEVEMLFYVGMFSLFVRGALNQVHRWLWLLLACRIGAWALFEGAGIEVSWTLTRILILKYIAWFALGISMHSLVLRREHRSREPWMTVVLATMSIALVDRWELALLALVLAALVAAAAAERLPWLRHRVLVFFGAISYPLYLLHENIGWVVMRALQARGWSPDAMALAALAVAIPLAWGLSVLVEQPALRWIRQRHRARQALA